MVMKMRNRGIMLVTVVAIGVVVTSLATIGLGFDVGESSSRRIIAIEQRWDGSITARYVKVSDLKPNSSMLFLDPFNKTMQEFYKGSNPNPVSLIRLLEKADAYEYYRLIRLPEMYGGDANDISSYRAYSIVGINMLQKCLVGYRSERQWIEDPCSGDVYRVWDGIVIYGYSMSGNITGSPNALARLRLGVDSDGYIVAFKGDDSVRGDGIPGHGRIILGKDVIDSSRAMLNAVSKHLGINLPMIDGYIPTRVDVWHRWMDNINSNMQDKQYIDYINVSYVGINSTGISRYTLSIFDLTKHPILRLEQRQESSALTILNLLGYNPESDSCRYEKSTGSTDGKYYILISRWYLTGSTGEPSCSILEHTMSVWISDDADGVGGYLIIVVGYMLSSEEMLATVKALDIKEIDIS